ncbi:MAG: TonB-dependent receptor [Novosphingobium sp.]|nr:TonB-dependent receptor [Novosphingobium sp.]
MFTHAIRYPAAALVALGSVIALSPAVRAEEEDNPAPLTDTIIVSGHYEPAMIDGQDPETGHAVKPDAAALVATLPGAALIGNGALSGQVQYRGLFGERLSVRVGGQSFQSGGPNAMDPPLHYAPVILLKSVSVSRGAAQVSQGTGLGGAVDATLKTLDFGASSTFAPHVDMAASYRSVDDGVAIGGIAGAASDQARVNVIAAWEHGDDYRFPGGHAADTAYERLTYGLSGGLRQGNNTITLDYRRQETDPSGNPPFAMDIEYFNTDFLRAGFDGSVGGHALSLALSYTGVRHAMNNYALRPVPDSVTRYRRTLADADTYTATGKITFGALMLGMDASVVNRDVTITNPNNAGFSITSLRGIRERRVGGFAQVERTFGGWHVDAGVRVDDWRASMDNPQTGAAVPDMVQMLAMATAAANRSHDNTTWDAVMRIWREDGTVRPRLTLSRKSRVPNAVERFSWLPTEASGGLADGNIYIGNPSLRPEVAWAAEGGLDLVGQAVTFRPSVFYRRINNYIQGTPVPMDMMTQIMIATMNGDATPLVFSNVDAKLYGFDADVSWQIVPRLRFDAVVSYIRGKRRDIDDNLYRIAPLNGRASLTYSGDDWSVTGELVAAAAQHDVSVSNSESRSPGWAIANLWFDTGLAQGLRLSGGVENVFDRHYADHLSGLNRVAGSDVAVGERMPASGRGVFLRLGATF